MLIPQATHSHGPIDQGDRHRHYYCYCDSAVALADIGPVPVVVVMEPVELVEQWALQHRQIGMAPDEDDRQPVVPGSLVHVH